LNVRAGRTPNPGDAQVRRSGGGLVSQALPPPLCGFASARHLLPVAGLFAFLGQILEIIEHAGEVLDGQVAQKPLGHE
jgi:hypothetical protein